jgi:hypothetical protein
MSNAKRVSMKTLANYARLLGPGSLAQDAYLCALQGKRDGLPVAIEMVNSGFLVTVAGIRSRFA